MYNLHNISEVLAKVVRELYAIAITIKININNKI